MNAPKPTAQHLPDRPDALRAALADAGGSALAVGVFSAAANLLLLTGPLFMLQVYDRVLPAESAGTLGALFLIVTFAFIIMGGLDALRARIMLRAAARIQLQLDPCALVAFRDAAAGGRTPRAGPADLDLFVRALGSPAVTAVFDLPFAPVFLALLLHFHPLLGALAIAGAAIMMGVAIVHGLAIRAATSRALARSRDAERLAAEMNAASAQVDACDLAEGMTALWLAARRGAVDSMVAAADRSAVFGAFSRGFRLYLQSAMLALGAWLCLQAELSAGAIVAASVVMGRALAPLEQLAAGWAQVMALVQSVGRLRSLRRNGVPPAVRIALPRPTGLVVAEGVTVTPPGRPDPAVRDVRFRVGPGEALAIVGPSGSGKSTLVQAIAGVLPVAAGALRLDGALPDAYGAAELARHVGYMPQRPHLFAGTIGQNIARMRQGTDPAAIVAAARRAGAHEMILSLPAGYDTPVGPFGAGLSGGQIQRIALARAVFGDPVVLVLDEPDGALDPAGLDGLAAVLRRHRDEGGTAIVCSHRGPTVGACDKVLVLEGGRQCGFGPVREFLGGAPRVSSARGRSGMDGATRNPS